MTTQEFRDEALAMKPDARAELAHALIASLDEPDPLFDEELDQVIARRVDEITAGKAQGRPAFRALDEIKSQLR